MNASKEEEREEDEEEEEEVSWETLLQNRHLDQWKSWDPQDTKGNIAKLDRQLQEYSTSRLCSSEEGEEGGQEGNGYPGDPTDLIPGTGRAERPLVVFVARHLSKYEKYRKTYFRGDWAEFMKTRMNSMGLRPEACYYAYLFPFTIAENYPSEDQGRIFLPYLAKRIEWMRPKVVVGLGKSVCKYLAAEFVQAKISDSPFNFDKFLEDTIPSQQNNKKKKKKAKLLRFANPKDAVMMGSPHPFSLLQNQRAAAAASPSNPKKESVDWENLLVALKDFLFPHRISGPKVYDTRDGKYKIDPLHAVKKAAEMEYEERKKRKREEEEKKKNVVAASTRDPNDNSVPQNGKTECGREETEKRIKLSKNQSNLDGYFSLERGIEKKGEEEEEEVTVK